MNIGSLILSGIAIGCIYALMALAINVVFSAQRIVNFAQGDITMMSGLVAASLITAWAWPTGLQPSELRWWRPCWAC